MASSLGLFFYREKLHQILCVFTTRLHRRRLSEMETELRELGGAPQAYERLLDNLQAKVAESARRRSKMDPTLDVMAPVPARTLRHRPARQPTAPQ